MSKNKWFVVPKPNPNADLKLICFPYAGGNSFTYLSWVKQLPINVELIIVQPPGRGQRIFDPVFNDMTSLVEELLKYFPMLLNKPYILFGHSLGSRVAFELMAQLKELKYPLPNHFIASGSKGPHIISDKKTHKLSNDEFIVELEKLNGTPTVVLENKELMDLFLPVLKADFSIAENYQYKGDQKFNCAISVLGGRDDSDISFEKLKSWEDLFIPTAQIHVLDGDHFFIDNNQDAVLLKINVIINNYFQKSERL